MPTFLLKCAYLEGKNILGGGLSLDQIGGYLDGALTLGRRKLIRTVLKDPVRTAQ
jgi:hypothetical protein